MHAIEEDDDINGAIVLIFLKQLHKNIEERGDMVKGRNKGSQEG